MLVPQLQLRSVSLLVAHRRRIGDPPTGGRFVDRLAAARPPAAQVLKCPRLATSRPRTPFSFRELSAPPRVCPLFPQGCAAASSGHGFLALAGQQTISSSGTRNPNGKRRKSVMRTLGWTRRKGGRSRMMEEHCTLVKGRLWVGCRSRPGRISAPQTGQPQSGPRGRRRDPVALVTTTGFKRPISPP